MHEYIHEYMHEYIHELKQMSHFALLIYNIYFLTSPPLTTLTMVPRFDLAQLTAILHFTQSAMSNVRSSHTTV